MALINCPKCGKQISDRAAKCPYCGFVPSPPKNEQLASSSGQMQQEAAPKKTHKKWWIVIVVAALLVMIIALWLFVFRTQPNTSTSVLQTNTNTEQQTAVTNQQNESRLFAESESDNASNSVFDYLMKKDASSYSFTKSDLASLSPTELSYLRNHIYAVHGYVFKSQELNDYFSQFSWYHPNPSVTSSVLNSTEKANAEFIRKYQEEYGKTYQLDSGFSERRSNYSSIHYVVIDGSELRLRLGPSTSADTFKWGDGTNRHPKVGEKFKYLGESGDFYQIDFHGHRLWVSKLYTHVE